MRMEDDIDKEQSLDLINDEINLSFSNFEQQRNKIPNDFLWLSALNKISVSDFS